MVFPFSIVSVVGSLLVAGCVSVTPTTAIGHTPRAGAAEEHAARVESVGDDPVAYLKRVAANCAKLEQYTLTLTREERRGMGLFQYLHPPERIRCWFRREPFSVRMKWLDPDVKYGESAYVAGQADDRVRFVPRRWPLGLRPRIVRIRLGRSVSLGEAKYPMTDFGLERLMDRTLATMEQVDGDFTIEYRGLSSLGENGRLAHFFLIDFSHERFAAPIQELYIDVQTDLPIATRILTPSGELDAAYLYEDLDPSVSLSDEDFLLPAERRARSKENRGGRSGVAASHD